VFGVLKHREQVGDTLRLDVLVEREDCGPERSGVGLQQPGVVGDVPNTDV
jgi:hypothetical protein